MSLLEAKLNSVPDLKEPEHTEAPKQIEENHEVINNNNSNNVESPVSNAILNARDHVEESPPEEEEDTPSGEMKIKDDPRFKSFFTKIKHGVNPDALIPLLKQSGWDPADIDLQYPNSAFFYNPFYNHLLLYIKSNPDAPAPPHSLKPKFGGLREDSSSESEGEFEDVE